MTKMYFLDACRWLRKHNYKLRLADALGPEGLYLYEIETAGVISVANQEAVIKFANQKRDEEDAEVMGYC